MREIDTISKPDGVYNRIYADVFKFHKRYFNAGQADPEECVRLSQDAGALYDKYGVYGPQYRDFVSGLLLAIERDIECALNEYLARRRGRTA